MKIPSHQIFFSDFEGWKSSWRDFENHTFLTPKFPESLPVQNLSNPRFKLNLLTQPNKKKVMTESQLNSFPNPSSPRNLPIMWLLRIRSNKAGKGCHKERWTKDTQPHHEGPRMVLVEFVHERIFWKTQGANLGKWLVCFVCGKCDDIFIFSSHQSGFLIETKNEEIYFTKKKDRVFGRKVRQVMFFQPWIFYYINTREKSRRKNQVMSNPTTPMHDLQTHVGRERMSSNSCGFLENMLGPRGRESSSTTGSMSRPVFSYQPKK